MQFFYTKFVYLNDSTGRFRSFGLEELTGAKLTHPKMPQVGTEPESDADDEGWEDYGMKPDYERAAAMDTSEIPELKLHVQDAVASASRDYTADRGKSWLERTKPELHRKAEALYRDAMDPTKPEAHFEFLDFIRANAPGEGAEQEAQGLGADYPDYIEKAAQIFEQREGLKASPGDKDGFSIEHPLMEQMRILTDAHNITAGLAAMKADPYKNRSVYGDIVMGAGNKPNVELRPFFVADRFQQVDYHGSHLAKLMAALVQLVRDKDFTDVLGFARKVIAKQTRGNEDLPEMRRMVPTETLDKLERGPSSSVASLSAVAHAKIAATVPDVAPQEVSEFAARSGNTPQSTSRLVHPDEHLHRPQTTDAFFARNQSLGDSFKLSAAEIEAASSPSTQDSSGPEQNTAPSSSLWSRGVSGLKNLTSKAGNAVSNLASNVASTASSVATKAKEKASGWLNRVRGGLFS